MSEISTCTLCKSLVMINWHHIMNNTNKCMNKMCCIYSVNQLRRCTPFGRCTQNLSSGGYCTSSLGSNFKQYVAINDPITEPEHPIYKIMCI